MAVTQKQHAYMHICRQLISGDLKPGSRVSDVDLAKQIGVSRTPIREAISRLESEGLVKQVPRFGAFVRKLSRAEIAEMYALRALLESYVITLAAERIGPQDLEVLEQLCDEYHDTIRRMRSARDDQEQIADLAHRAVLLDVRFHMKIVRISETRMIAKIISDFRIMSSICGRERLDPDDSPLGRAASTWAAHVRILRALKRHDGVQAAELMRIHLEAAQRSVLKRYDENAWDAEDRVDTTHLHAGQLDSFAI